MGNLCSDLRSGHLRFGKAMNLLLRPLLDADVF
jgi:hypothetical protein